MHSSFQKPSLTISTNSFGNYTTRELHIRVALQGEQVRKLKAKKADKPIIDENVKNLLELKANYKKVRFVLQKIHFSFVIKIFFFS